METDDVAMALDAPPATDAPAAVVSARPNAGGQVLAGQTLQAPATSEHAGLPEGTNWRCSVFLEAVDSGKVERVRFSKDGSHLQLTAVEGRWALLTLPNDPKLVDLLAKNGAEISVSEGESQGNCATLIRNLLFPLVAFGGLFFLFRRAQGGGNPMGGGGGPMEFG